MAEESWFHSQERQKILFFFTVSKPVVRPTQHNVPWVPGTVDLVLKWLGREAVHSPPWGANGLHRDICTLYCQALVGFCFRYTAYIIIYRYLHQYTTIIAWHNFILRMAIKINMGATLKIPHCLHIKYMWNKYICKTYNYIWLKGRCLSLYIYIFKLRHLPFNHIRGLEV